MLGLDNIIKGFSICPLPYKTTLQLCFYKVSDSSWRKYSGNTLVNCTHTKNAFHTSRMSPLQWNSAIRVLKTTFFWILAAIFSSVFIPHACFDFYQTRESYFAYAAKISEKYRPIKSQRLLPHARVLRKRYQKSSENFSNPGDEVANFPDYVPNLNIGF